MKLSLRFKKFFLFAFCLSNISLAQQIKTPTQHPVSNAEKCGFASKHALLLQNDANYAIKRQQEEIHIENFLRNPQVEKVVLTIPVVIHVIHKGEAVGVGTNISTAQIQSAIDNLNTAYANGGAYTGVNTEIQFCMAQRDPNGNPSTGINRVNGSTLTGYIAGGVGTGGASDVSVKALSNWDHTRFYNFWIVSEIDNNNGGAGTQGYAYFPGAGPTIDGAIMLYNAFGYDPNGTIGYNLKSYTNRNATPIHEVGHALNLYHTFEGDDPNNDNIITCPTNSNGCGDNIGDCITDVPAHKRSNSDCLTNTNDASCGNVDRDLYVHNFMDYSSDVCQSEFSADQAARMTATLTSGGLRASLTTSDACNPVFVNDVSVSNIVAPNGIYCFTSFSPQITLKNVGTANLTSATITYNIDGGANQIFSWTGNLASGSSTIVTLNSITTSAGAHTFNATSTLPNGLADQYTPNNLASQTFTIGSALPLPFVENFEGTFPPADWTNTSEDGLSNDTWGTQGFKMWEKRATAGNTGSTSSAGINNFNNSYTTSIGTSDALTTPSIDLTIASAPSLTFKVAHKNYTGYSDSLRVLISTDCGINYAPIYTKFGTSLATNGTSTATFNPTVTGDWRTETIDLLAYAGDIVKLKFESINQYGNNIYIDNINLIDNCTNPIVTAQASNSTNCSGTNASFSITNSGGGTFQWQENSGGGFTNIANGGVYSNALTSTLNLTGVTFGMNNFTYRCVVTNNCGSVNSNPATLTVNASTNPVISVSQTSGDAFLCTGQRTDMSTNTQNLSVTYTGYVSAPTFQWQISGNNIGTNSSSILVTAANAALGSNLVCIVTSNDVCSTSPILTSNTHIVNLRQNPTAPIIVANGATTFCSGTVLGITCSNYDGNNINNWSQGNLNTPVINISSTDNYFLRATINGCYSESNIIPVTVNPTPATPTISASGSTTFCSGGSVILTSSETNGNTWSNGATSQSVTISANVSLTVSSTLGSCTSPNSSSISVVVNPTPSITLGSFNNPSACATTTGSVQISGTGTGNLSWTGTLSGNMNAVTLPINVTNLGAGSYTFSFDNGCISNSITQTLTDPGAPATPIISASGSTNLCAGSTLTLTSSESNGLIWSNGATTQSIVVSSAGSFSVSTTLLGCTSNSASTNVSIIPIPSTPSISAGGSTTFCSGGNVVLTSSASSGNVWSTGETTQSITANTGGNITVTELVNGCSSNASANTIVSVTNGPAISLGNSINPSTCLAIDGSVEILGTATGTLTWSGTTSVTLNGITLPNTISNLGAGIYSFTFNDGCLSNVLSASIVEPTIATPTISANGPTNICAGDVVILSSSAANGNSWSSGETSQTINVTEGGFYTVTTTNGNCSATAIPLEITINALPPTPTITASGSLSFCDGNSVSLSSSASSGNNWSTGETTQTIFVINTATITVSIGTGNCQVTSAPTSTTMNMLPNTSLAPINDMCNTEGSFELSGGLPVGGVYTYSGNIITSFDLASNLGSQTVFYSFTDANSCSNSVSQEFTVNDCANIIEETTSTILIYPNPTNSLIFLSGLNVDKISTLELRDELGRIVEKFEVNSTEMNLDLSRFGNGIYMLILKGQNFNEFRKIELIK